MDKLLVYPDRDSHVKISSSGNNLLTEEIGIDVRHLDAPIKSITVNVDFNDPPKEYNGKPVFSRWKEAGGKPKPFIVINHKLHRLVQCQNGYVLLCVNDRCQNLQGRNSNKCKNHNDGKEIYIYCRYGECTKRGVFGYEKGKGLRCKEHADSNMENVVCRKCEHPNCKTQPIYGFKEESARFCTNHKLEGMIDVVHTKCLFDGCNLIPSYGYEGESAQYCYSHKLEEMIDVYSKRCEFDGCKTQPVFGYEGESARFCFLHKSEGMINVRCKQCEFDGCKTQCVYGYEGEAARFCFIHKLEGMLDVVCKRCVADNCKIRPTFGYEGESAQYCCSHKLDGMIDVNNRKCIVDNCTTVPVFGYEGQSAQYCRCHRLDGMIDVVNRKCGIDNCRTQPSFGRLYSTINLFCHNHSSLNEYSNNKMHPVCQSFGCQNTAYFVDINDNSIYPIRCNVHKIIGDIELLYKECLNCQQSLYFPSNKNICMQCGSYRIRNNLKYKENLVKCFFESNKIPLIHNKRVSPYGSRYMPDFLIDSKFGKIIVEVDENQHTIGYDQNDEIRRMIHIYHDVQLIKPNAQVLFIRFNPDKYKGCLRHKFKDRYDYLYVIVTHFINEITIGLHLGKIMLYYDGFDGNPSIEPIV